VKLRAGYSGAELTGAFDDDDAKELFAYFGLAIHVANILEYGVLQALFVLDMLPRVREFESAEQWGKAHDEFFDEGFKQTYGNLLKRLDKSAEISTDMMSMLSQTKKTRDYLVHHFQRESADTIFSIKGRTKALETCRIAIDLFDSADKKLYTEFAPVRKRLGVDDAWFEKRVREEMDKIIAMDKAND
jgi:hypothetical protein